MMRGIANIKPTPDGSGRECQTRVGECKCRGLLGIPQTLNSKALRAAECLLVMHKKRRNGFR